MNKQYAYCTICDGIIYLKYGLISTCLVNHPEDDICVTCPVCWKHLDEYGIKSIANSPSEVRSKLKGLTENE